MNPKVFVVQKIDAEKSIESASTHGDLTFIMEGFVDLRNPVWVDVVRERLEGFRDVDFLLLSGNKLLNAVSAGILAMNPKVRVVNFLHWFGPYNTYVIHQWRKSNLEKKGGE